jgi:hypothetical protein
MLALAAIFASGVAVAAQAPVDLLTADSYAVLAGAGITNTGASVIVGDLGACTGTITGITAAMVSGTTSSGGVACGTPSAAATAYTEAAGRAATDTYAPATDLGGLTLAAGVHKSPSSFAVTGALTLDGEGDPEAVFIFQASSTLGTAANSTVSLINGAQACNVFWPVGSSATLGANSTLVGSVLAVDAVTAGAGAVVQGRLIARDGAITLAANTVTRPVCAVGGTLSLAQTPTEEGTPLVEGSPVALPVTTVTDSRYGVPRSWTVTASVTPLVSGANSIPAADITLAQSGTFTAGDGDLGTEGLLSATNATRSSVYTYTPTAELAPQVGLPAGSYTGTISQTVV